MVLIIVCAVKMVNSSSSSLSSSSSSDAQKDALDRLLQDLVSRADTAYMDFMRRTHDEPMPTHFFTWDTYMNALKFDHPQATLSRADIQENAADQRSLFKLPRPTGLQPFACQQPDCPLYMVPRHDLDAHLAFDKQRFEEEEENDAVDFPLALHITAYYCAQDPNKGLDETLEALRDGTYLVTHRGDPHIHARQRQCVDAHRDALERMLPQVLDMYRRQFASVAT